VHASSLETCLGATSRPLTGPPVPRRHCHQSLWSLSLTAIRAHAPRTFSIDADSSNVLVIQWLSAILIQIFQGKLADDDVFREFDLPTI
jgi:hypothetical protein